MNLRKLIAVGASALALGTGAGIFAASADATIGPYGGRYVQAQPAYGFAGVQISFAARGWGNGGTQTVNTRVMRYTGSGWVQVGDTKNLFWPAGDTSWWADYHVNCNVHGTYVYTVWTKWSSWLWNNADISAGKYVTCS